MSCVCMILAIVTFQHEVQTDSCMVIITVPP